MRCDLFTMHCTIPIGDRLANYWRMTIVAMTVKSLVFDALFGITVLKVLLQVLHFPFLAVSEAQCTKEMFSSNYF